MQSGGKQTCFCNRVWEWRGETKLLSLFTPFQTKNQEQIQFRQLKNCLPPAQLRAGSIWCPNCFFFLNKRGLSWCHECITFLWCYLGRTAVKINLDYKSGCRIKEGSVFQFVEGMINPKRKEKYSNCSPEVSESDPRFCEVSLDT